MLLSLEKYAKRNGMLQGGTPKVGKLDATIRGDVPQGFLDTLSGMMRWTHASNYIFHQFPLMRFDPGSSNGDTIQIPRAARRPEAATRNDRQLSGSGVYAPITTDRESLATGNVSIVLEEFGMGKDAASAPLMVTDFLTGYSMINLMNILQANIGYDYLAWEDVAIRELWDPTSRVYYNNGNEPTTVPGDVVAGSDGRLTRLFLNNLYAQMRADKIPTFRNGRYALITSTFPMANLTESLEDRAAPPSPDAILAITNMLNMGRPNDMMVERVDGYMGAIENFEVFETNAFGTGAAGAPGVQTEALGTGATDTYTSYAVGAETIGRGIGMPMTIRQDEFRDFGRSDAFIWLSHESFAPLDVDPTGYADANPIPQQLRVYKVNTTKTAV